MRQRIPKRGTGAGPLLIRRRHVLDAVAKLGRDLLPPAAPLRVREGRFQEREGRDVAPIELAGLLKLASARERLVSVGRFSRRLEENGSAEREIVVHRALGVETRG